MGTKKQNEETKTTSGNMSSAGIFIIDCLLEREKNRERDSETDCVRQEGERTTGFSSLLAQQKHLDPPALT